MQRGCASIPPRPEVMVRQCAQEGIAPHVPPLALAAALAALSFKHTFKHTLVPIVLDRDTYHLSQHEAHTILYHTA